jgi:adenylosuccinate lyase
MIDRYTRPEMGAVWTEDHKFRKWLDVEVAVCEAWQQIGVIPAESVERIKSKASFSVPRIEEIERTVKHDVIAFLTCVGEYLGEDSRFVHLGLTSYDVVDTALSLLFKESLLKVRQGLVELAETVKREALRHKMTVMVGRTHGVHAEPITFGVKLLVWYEEVKRHLDRVDRSLEVVSVGRISGSVGTYIHLDTRVEVIALAKLGLKPARVSTQVLQRDRHAEVMSCLALIASSLDKFATEVRHHQRTEVLELEEPFTRGQKGSSSMPHKKNPVRAERISGLARIVRGSVQTALENVALWHERDISHSSTERVIFPDAFILTDFILAEMTDIIRNWAVHPDRMKENVNLTRGLVFSQSLLLALTRKNMSREDAYHLIQRNSLKAWDEKKDLKSLVLADPDIRGVLTPEEIESSFSLDPYLEKIDYIFERVLGHEG